MTVPDKATARRLYEAGAFGNKLRTWNAYCDWMRWWHDTPREITSQALYALRVWAPGGGAPFVPDLAESEVQDAYIKLLSWGWDADLITVNECAPDDRLLVQGELMRVVGGLYFRYNTAPLRMREGMKRAKDMEGLQVTASLRHWLSPSSASDLEELLELYPDDVIEMSAYDCFLGNCPGRNMIVWEVRGGY
jgi:hypothetical protein